MTPEVPAQSPEKNPPRISVELKQNEVKGIDGLKPGDKVKVVIYGEVTEVSIREPYDSSSIKYVGQLYMESTRTQVTEDKSTTMSDLADEDE